MLPRDPGPPPASEREQIREALLDLCFEGSYRQLTLPQLLQRSGLDEEAFHRHFEDLEDCFCEVYLEIREDFLARLAEELVGQPTWRDRIRSAAYFMLRFFAEDERVTHLGIVEVRTAGERAQLLFAGVFEALFDLLDQGRSERQEPQLISRATAESLGGAIFGQIYAAIGNGSPLREDVVPKLMYVAVLPYLGPEAAGEELGSPPAPRPLDDDGL